MQLKLWVPSQECKCRFPSHYFEEDEARSVAIVRTALVKQIYRCLHTVQDQYWLTEDVEL